MPSLEDRVEVIRSETEALKAYLNTLTPDAWSRPSACKLWEIRDVVGHLVWVAEFYLDIISRGIKGDPSAPEGRPPADALNAPSFDQYIAQRAIARRERLGGKLLSTFEARYEELNRLLAGLGPQDWKKPCSFWRSRTIPVEGLTFLAVQELVIHGWDIRSQIEPGASLSPASLMFLIERIPRRPAPWSTPFRTTFESATVRYRFELKGTAPGRYDVVVENGQAQMELASEAKANLVISCPADTFVLLMYGRHSVASALAVGLAAIEGDPGLVADFDRWLKGG
jgi:uncharacterized protein (TIGR03083 family)